jgi:hypothetical protein
MILNMYNQGLFLSQSAPELSSINLLLLRFGFIGYRKALRLLPSGPQAQGRQCATADRFTRLKRDTSSYALPKIFLRTSQGLALCSKFGLQESSDLTGSGVGRGSAYSKTRDNPKVNPYPGLPARGREKGRWHESYREA